MLFAAEAELKIIIFEYYQHFELNGVEFATCFFWPVHVVGFAAPNCPSEAPCSSNADDI
jgi:hypothetical protein